MNFCFEIRWKPIRKPTLQNEVGRIKVLLYDKRLRKDNNKKKHDKPQGSLELSLLWNYSIVYLKVTKNSKYAIPKIDQSLIKILSCGFYESISLKQAQWVLQ